MSKELFPQASELQLSVVQSLITGSFLFDLVSSSYDLKLNEKAISKVILPGAPDDQWVKEMIWWESVSWASIQMFLTDLALGMGKEKDFNLQLPTEKISATEKQLCGMQRMRSPSGFV